MITELTNTNPEGLKSIASDAFEYCSLLSSINLPSTLETIESYSFYGIAADSITMPTSIKTIEDDAFGRCPNLKAVTFLGKMTEDMSIDNAAFYGCADCFTIYVYDTKLAEFLKGVNSDWNIVVISDDGTMTNYEGNNAGK